MLLDILLYTLCAVLSVRSTVEVSSGFCVKPLNSDSTPICDEPSGGRLLQKYILYDVNPPEGFNLRRDVYMRMAVFVRKLKNIGDWHLVLPPWGRLYHWDSADIGAQIQIPWSLFFDVASLQKFAPVLEMSDFLKAYGSTTIDEVLVLQHYKDSFKSGKFVEKYDFEPCISSPPYSQKPDGTFSGWFWGFSNISAKQVRCLSFHGFASQLQNVLKLTSSRSVMFDQAEVALHDAFGDRMYWMARRSMRFSANLQKIAADFRIQHLNSSDEIDGTVKPADWRQEKAKSGTKGGPYLCVHLRRKDFLWGRSKQVPSLLGAASQINRLLNQFSLETVFVATDAPQQEFEELQAHMEGYQVLRYTPTQSIKMTYKDGGIAIIEQIICSHARYFIGSYESTFSFRIQEEREIMGFPWESTFNRLCGDEEDNCKRPSKWRIVF